MPRLQTLLIVSLIVLGACRAEDVPVAAGNAREPVSLDSEKQQTSYAMGTNLARQIRGQGLSLDVASFVAGIEDAWRDESRMTDAEVAAKLAEFQSRETERRRQLADAQAQANRELGEKNLVAAQQFFSQNGARDAVTTTASGLQYEVITAAEGPRPAAAATVTVHYRGTLLDGTEFDSSYARGEPAVFALDQVIPGWTEGVQLMSVGSKYRLFVPAELAYGPGGAGDAIGPNAALIFDVELLAIGVTDSSDG